MITTTARLVVAGCVALALTFAGSITAGASTTDRAPAGETRAQAAGACAKPKAKVAKAKKAVKKAQKKVAKAKRAKQGADGAKALKKAKKQLAAKKKALKRAKAKLAKCRADQGPGEPQPENPLQPACDLGLPQEVCDAFATLPLPSTGGASPIQALCDAGLPQPICDAAGGAPGPGGASPIQPLCDAGLPQAICDAAAGGGEAPDPGTILNPLCDVLPLPVCDLLGVRAA